jgi:hypothetical protein
VLGAVVGEGVLDVPVLNPGDPLVVREQGDTEAGVFDLDGVPQHVLILDSQRDEPPRQFAAPILGRWMAAGCGVFGTGQAGWRVRQAEKLVLRRSTDPTWQALHADPDWKRLHEELSELKRRFAEKRRKWEGRLLEELTPADRAEEHALTNQEERESRPIMLALVKVQDRYGPADPIKTPADLLESLARLDVDLPLWIAAAGFKKPEDAWEDKASAA